MQASEKKAANIAAAAARLKIRQKLDAERDANRNNRITARLAAIEAEKAAKKKAEDEAKFVEDSLAGPSALPLRRWLKDRQPTFDRVQRFFNERPNLPRIAQKIAA